MALCGPELGTCGGAATSQNPALVPPNGPPTPSTPALGGFRPPQPPQLACAIARGLVVKKKRGLGVGKGDPKRAGFPPEIWNGMGGGGNGKST